MRTFIAVEIPDDIKEKVGDYLDSIRGMFDNKMKWIFPGNLHFTIKFLGEVQQSDIGVLEECVSNTASGFDPFVIGLSGIGFFPSERNPRVIWLGADGGGDGLLEVYHKLESCLEHHGFDRDSKPFSPHLTIGRVRKHLKLVVPKEINEFEPVTFKVNSLAIIKSVLTPRGPVYERLFESGFKKSI